MSSGIAYRTSDSRFVSASGLDPMTGHLGLITADDVEFVKESGDQYVKIVPTRMVRMDGPFKVLTPHGPVECLDGWLAIDSRGDPYPISVEEQADSFAEVSELV